MSGDPQAALEAQVVARALLQRPLICAEHDPEQFRLIRRHAATLDRWFTQRFGDRVHVDADTARLYKSIAPPRGRPLRTGTGRPLRQVEYVMLALSMAAVASGPDVISLRDLVASVRSAAADAGVEMTAEASDRRALVSALQWMIAQGLMVELHDRVERYTTDGAADAVLKVRADRIALVSLSGTSAAETADDLRRRANERGTTRQRMRARLANDPVVYRDELEPDDWSELRRRLGEEASILDEVLGLGLEARAEGVAAIDPSGSLSDRRFPAGGTESHAALLLIDRLVADSTGPSSGATPEVGDAASGAAADGETGRRRHTYRSDELVTVMAELAAQNVRRWKRDLVERPEHLLEEVVALLVDLRLAARVVPDGTGTAGSWSLRLLPGAARFALVSPGDPARGLLDGGPPDRGPQREAAADGGDQGSLW